jgi:hypothetical protein
MNYLHGIQSIGSLPPLPHHLSAEIRHQSTPLRKLLGDARSASLRGLGRTENKTLSFDQVVERYNKGISREEIEAWVWYKRQQGVPMSGWNRYYINEKGRQLEERLKQLVHQGALFYLDGELLPYPIYTYGNMYDRMVQLEKDQAYILDTFGQEGV